MSVHRFLAPGAVLLVALAPAHAASLGIADMLANAGLAIVPIVGLSVLALTVSLQCLRRCRRATVVPDGLLELVLPLWRSGDHEGAKRLLDEADASLLAHGLSKMWGLRHDAPRAVQTAAELAARGLRAHQQRLYPLAVCATVAPIIGLLGTVVGMIESFHVIAFSGGMGDPAQLAGGISKALVNTAAGLSVALPSLLAYHFFKHRLSGYGLELEHELTRAQSELFDQAAPQTAIVKAVANAD